MSAYLAEHLPHLQSLHSQLALDSKALQEDQERIESAIKLAVESLLREREQQVDQYKDVIAGQKRRMSCLARALGDKGRNVVSEGRRESVENENLPAQLERLVKQSEELEKVYDERLKHIEKQQSYLNQLAILLGSPFEPAKPLQPLISSSTQAPGLARIVSGTAAGVRLSAGGDGRSRRSGSALSIVDEKGEQDEGLYDVGESITQELDVKVTQALEERATRLMSLTSTFFDLRTLHTELSLQPIPISQPHHFPIHLLPSRAMEETPGSNADHEKLLSRVISEKASLSVNEEGEEIEGDFEALEGVEPEVGLIRWVEEVRNLWEKEQDVRAARIQQLFDQIEPLWQRLQLDQDQMDLFIQMNIGCSEAAIKAYEFELERCLELRRSSLSSFIVGARAEIEVLWIELMLSEDEKSEFGGFINDDYSEELLADHELYAEQLKAEVESKATLLPKVREWHVLVNDEEELEKAQNDPDRYKRRGGAMLREEKLRKRVTILKPKVECELLNHLPGWEEANGRPFMVQGERVMDKIYEALEAKEAAKEAKKLARMGLAPKAVPARALAPAKTVKPTPSQSTRSSSTTSSFSSISKKREAPTPTPLSFNSQTNKRQKLAAPPSSLKSYPSTSRTTSASSNNRNNLTLKTKSHQTPSPTLNRTKPPPPPTFTSSLPTSSSGIPTLSSKIPLPKLVPNHLSKAPGRKPKRESFKPRQSIVAGGGMIRGIIINEVEEMEGMEEVLEVDEDDVFE